MRKFFGTDLVWEDWMDGNMNNCLYYSGLVFHFDRCDAHAPLPSASLTTIEIFRRSDCLFRGRPMTEWSEADVQSRLAEEGVAFSNPLTNAIAIPQWNTEISFNADRHCEHFWIDHERIEYSAGQDLTLWQKVRKLFG